MSYIIKTIESWRDPRRVIRWLHAFDGNKDACFYFPIGRGMPKRSPVTRLYFTFRGRVMGWFKIAEFQVMCPTLLEWMISETGSMPENQDREPTAKCNLNLVYKGGKRWFPKLGTWVVFCSSPFHRTKKRIYMQGFRGFRYFDLKAGRFQ